MQLPSSFLDAIKNAKGFNDLAFRRVHESGERVTSVRLNPFKLVGTSQWPGSTPIPWTDHGFYLPKRPSFTFDPLFHAGTYYVQEASSMFLGQALQQTVELTRPLKVLDLCAAPGGKSTHIQSLLSKDSWLVSNEAIRARVNVLKDNIIKWGCENVVVTNNDPRDFAKMENYFDVIVVDAPCSGSGLFRRDPGAIEEWSENNVQLCCQRQQRILADVWPALKTNGVLIYSTCSYSTEEDEEIADWLANVFLAESLKLTIRDEWGIVETGRGYRFWPDKVKGEGFFVACFKKNGTETPDHPIRNQYNRAGHKLSIAGKKDLEVIKKWVKTEGKIFFRHLNTVYAWPELQAGDFILLLQQLRVIYSGTLIGELVRDKLIPDHALAMSTSVADTIERAELDQDQSIQYLQRKELQVEIKNKGWQLVTYQQRPLGWMNVLSNRINNYYPKESRILKDNYETH